MKKAVWYNDFKADDKIVSSKRSNLAGTLVKIKDYNPANHSLKVVRLDDGQPLIGNIDTTQDIQRSKEFEQPKAKTLKTLAAPGAPIIEVNDHEASIRGSSDNGFYSFKDFGNVVKGPISFSAQPHEMKMSGIMNFHPLLLSGFPSTMNTPIPVLQWSLPSASMLAPIAKDIALISTLIGVV